MNTKMLFWGGLLLLVLGIVLGIFFLIPGIPHVIADSHTHIKHAIAFFIVGIVGLLAALVNRSAVRAL